MSVAARESLTAISASTRIAGVYGGLSATLCAVVYIAGQLAEWAGWLGSQGGPESTSTPLGIVVLLTPSILLGPSFVVLIAAVLAAATHARKVWGHVALAFAVIYATLTGLVYYVQLTWVGPRIGRGDLAGIEVFRFVPFDSFLYAADILGYSFMSLATLAAAAVFARADERPLRIALVANGLLVPFIALQMYVHALIWVAALWALTFPAATMLLTAWFRRGPAALDEGGVW